jgi:hypothetical protein
MPDTLQPGESFFPRLPLSQALEGARSTDLTNKPPQIRQQYGQRSTSSAQNTRPLSLPAIPMR